MAGDCSSARPRGGRAYLVYSAWGGLLSWALGCTTDPSFASDSVGGTPSAGFSGASGSSGGRRYFFGETEVPGLDPSACEGPIPERVFGVSSDVTVSMPGPYVVLTGTLPASIGGSDVATLAVRGSARGVRIDPSRNVWTYFLAAMSGEFEIIASPVSGATSERLSRVLSLMDEPVPSRDIEHHRTVGAWMFTMFDGDPTAQCGAPWRPAAGFASWDGSMRWAREQLLDQSDAHLDLVGLVVDSALANANDGAGFDKVANVLKAASELIDEGVFPPRLFPILDAAAIAAEYEASQNLPLDLSTEAGRAHFYAPVRAFYETAREVFEPDKLLTAVARIDGRPAVAVGRSATLVGANDDAVLDFKARFAADFGSDCYFIANVDTWGSPVAADEMTQMFGLSAHYIKSGHDSTGLATIALTPGFWNPISDSSYLPREGGSYFAEAWQRASADRDGAWHIWLDTWNDTRNGSGIFAGETLAFTALDQGPCGTFVNTRADSWGETSRLFIDVTRREASAWSNEPDLDARPVASDVPYHMRPGERRYVTVAMQNTGDALWTAENHKLGLTFSSAARDFHLDDLASFQQDEVVSRFGGIARGMTGVFTVLLTAPCAPGTHLVAFEIYDSRLGGFGSQLQREITVAP